MSTEGESILHDQSDFEYDYETLRTTGVIIGVILFVSGILIALTLIQQAPKYQRQMCHLQQYRRSIHGGEGESSWEVPLRGQHTHSLVYG
ncbi:phospholemman-like [Oncorhynchus keta]|uniref:phospholemman-like n=1 Tax=Oncorhynchus keta TaxID=8018 RepID=UPI00227C722F|nr:phospholemman-like [Oncorhynchus keta]